jgi:hypothetical protein
MLLRFGYDRRERQMGYSALGWRRMSLDGRG